MPAPEASSSERGRTLRAVTAACSRTLGAAGVEHAALDARLLVSAAIGLAASDFLARPDRLVSQREQQQIDTLLARRCAREPVSRILGTREFYGRPFSLSSATLDPRPDSETLIEMALEIAADAGWRERKSRILDVGTGSGCLLVTLLAELPLATGVGTDVDATALATAALNADHNGIGTRAAFVESDLLAGVEGPFDLVICNPPYIPTGDLHKLAPEVRSYDPLRALDGGVDGLDVYRRLIPDLPRLIPSGWTILEVGAGQAESVALLLRQASVNHNRAEMRTKTDLGGHIRCVAMSLQL